MTLSSCTERNVTKEEVGGIWFLKEIEGEEAAYIFGGGLPTLNFDWDNQNLFGTGGCNRYNASYELDGTDIQIVSMESTEVFCDNMEIEERFFLLMRNVSEIDVKKDTLLLKDGDKELLRFLLLDISTAADKKR